MISVTKLLGGPSFYGDRLRYADTSAKTQQGTSLGQGPVVVWNATKTCNLECVHCYADAAKAKFNNELTTAEAIALIDDLAGFNVPALLMSGGEPPVCPDAPKAKSNTDPPTAGGIPLIDALGGSNGPALLLAGGEPLVRPDILD